MTTLDETRLKAIRVINNIITLKANVFNGCYSDRAALAVEEARLDAIKNWAIENNQLQSIKHYFASKNFGSHLRFQAQEVATFFYN
jgi:hypothetical protein